MRDAITTRFEKQLHYIDELIERARHVIESEQDSATVLRDKPMLLGLFMLARATRALRSTKLLFLEGEVDDATSVMRTIAELLIDFAYIVNDEIDDIERAARAEQYENWTHVS